MKRRLGIDSKLYRNTNWNQTAGTGYDAPTWVAIDRIEDLTLDTGWTTAPAGDRGQGIEASAKTRARCQVTGTCRVDDDDGGYQALLAAFLSREAEIDVMVLNGSKTSNGAVGFRGLFQVNRFSEPQGSNAVLYRDMTLDPAPVDSDFPFQSVLVSGGVPVYTTAFAPPA